MQTRFDTGGMAMHCFNPRIISYGKQIAQVEEGCLSFPNETMVIKRPAEIEVEYHNHKGDLIQARLWGLNAICFQHELDHLDGIVMHDRFKKQNDKK